VRANHACRLDILDRLGSCGPLLSRELPDTCQVPWQSTGWTNNRNVTQLLEFMALRIQDAPFDKTMTAAVESEIKDLAHWLELDLTRETH
jgi:hypothetical protein